MSHVCSALYVFNTHPDAQDAIRSLRSSGFDVKKLSLIGKGHNSEQTPIGFYTGGDRILTWGSIGAVWGGIWGLLLAPAIFFLPGFALVAIIQTTGEAAAFGEQAFIPTSCRRV